MGMSVTADIAKKVWTEMELEALAEDGFIYEVVDGELMMGPGVSDFSPTSRPNGGKPIFFPRETLGPQVNF